MTSYPGPTSHLARLRGIHVSALLLLCALVQVPKSSAEQTMSSPKRIFDVPADMADRSLKRFSEQAGLEVLYSTQAAKGVRTQPVKGELSASDALRAMLTNTGLIYVQDPRTGAFAVRKARGADTRQPPASADAAGGEEPSDAEQKKKEFQKPQNQQQMKRNRLFTALAAIVGLSVAQPATAQPAGAGSIEGRVQNVTTGDYLNNARVSIDGTGLTALTNEFGEYRITNAPAGEVRMTVFYSGLPSESATVSILPDHRTVRDFELKSARVGNDVVKLESFTVSAARGMTDAAIATNEQRFAPNMKTVLSADEFGEQTQNNVAEFLKLMPSVSVEYVDQDARAVSLRGMPSNGTIVTANGNQLASATSSTANRAFEFEQISINDVARVEINKSLTPDMPAEGIGGTINLITKSAFERSRPEFKYRAYLNFNTMALDLEKRPGPGREATRRIHPGFDFTYINPVSKNLGFTISGASSVKSNPQYYTGTTWATNADPVAGAANPALQTINYNDGPNTTNRQSGRISVDWRIGANDVLSVGFSEQYFKLVVFNRRTNIQTGNSPAAFSADFTQGRPNEGAVTATGANNVKSGTTWTPEFKYLHTGPVWKFEAGGAFSHASNDYRDVQKGFFRNVSTTIRSFNAAGAPVAPTIRFDNNRGILPAVTAVLANGATVDPRDVNNMYLTSASSLNRKSTDVKKTARFNAQREVNLGVPISVKIGSDFRQMIRDRRETTPSYTFLGPDGKANSADDAVALYDLAETSYAGADDPFGLGRFTWTDAYKAWDMYLDHPEWWSFNEAAAHTSLVANSTYVDEVVTSGYIRLDAAFFRNRLRLTGGIRYQRYQVDTESGEVDNLSRYVHDENGDLVLDEAGLPIRLTGNSTEITKATNVERGVIRKDTLAGYYPSINAAYQLTDNIQIRAAYGDSVTYPNLAQVVAVTTVSDLTANPRRLTVNKPLKPWTAHNYDIDIEYYTPTGGSFTLAWFRKDISDFITQSLFAAGTPEAAEALERNGYGALIPLNYEVVEKYNAGEATLDGWEFAVNQKLDPFLPDWAHGITVFANSSYTAAPKGVGSSSLGAASSRRINWGARLKRGRLGLNLKWNHVPELKRLEPLATHLSSKTYLDIDVNYRISRRLTLFASGTNVTGVPARQYVYTDATPDYARRSFHRVYGIQCVAGVKGQF